MSESLVLFPSGKSRFVLDTWPIMEWLQDRAQVADYFDDLIERAVRREISLVVSMVNLGEIYYSSAKKWDVARAGEVLLRTRDLPITMVSVFDEEEVLSAARLKAIYPISYAYAFAACLAIRLNCPLITGDRDFHRLEDAGLLHLEWLGV